MVSNVRVGLGVTLLLGLTLSALLMLMATAPAQAQTCQTEITELRDATVNAHFSGQNAAKDQAGLLGKLDSATTKLGEGKTADALKNLNSFSLKVSDLADQGKLDPADANILLAKAGAVIDCIDPPEEPSQTTA
jgi:hypothetical protein